MKKDYTLHRYYLSLSSFSGIVPWASHWWCRIRWTDEAGEDHEADAEHGRGDERTGRFDTEKAARAAGLRLVRKLAGDQYYVVTEGSHCVIDPQPVLTAPGNLKARLNSLCREFEKMNGWEAPREQWPEVQKICDTWSNLIGDPSWSRQNKNASRSSKRSTTKNTTGTRRSSKSRSTGST